MPLEPLYIESVDHSRINLNEIKTHQTLNMPPVRHSWKNTNQDLKCAAG